MKHYDSKKFVAITRGVLFKSFPFLKRVSEEEFGKFVWDREYTLERYGDEDDDRNLIGAVVFEGLGHLFREGTFEANCQFDRELQLLKSTIYTEPYFSLLWLIYDEDEVAPGHIEPKELEC